MAIPSLPAPKAAWDTWGAAIDAAARAAVLKWQPSTAYTAGDIVINPSGQTVTANATFTSGASYSASNWTVVAGGGGGGGTVTDATTTAKGVVQLAGDLGGTAAAPTVPGLAAKANTSSLAAVATSGSYTDLSNKPTIPAAYTDEQAQDAAAALLTGGTHTGIAFTYDDAGNRVNATVTVGGGSVTSSSITDATTVGRSVLTAADGPTARAAIGALGASQAVELASSSAPALTQNATSTGLAADAGHTHRLPNAVAGDITLFTADGTPIILRVVNGVVGGGGGTAGTAPSQVTGLTHGTATQTAVPLSWTAPAAGTAAITDYVIQYSLTGANSWTTFADGTSTTTTATVTGLTAATAYDFRVAAVSTVGTGAWSATVSATTAAAGQALGFADNFNRADGPLGNGWDLDSQNGNQPNMQIVSNQAGKIGGDFNFAFATRDLGSADGTVSVTTTNAQNGLILRYIDRDNWIGFYENGLWLLTGGTRTRLDGGGFNTVGTLTVSMSGPNFTAYVNGSQVGTGTSTFHQTGTHHGIVRFVLAGTLDDFVFQGPA